MIWTLNQEEAGAATLRTLEYPLSLEALRRALIRAVVPEEEEGHLQDACVGYRLLYELRISSSTQPRLVRNFLRESPFWRTLKAIVGLRVMPSAGMATPRISLRRFSNSRRLGISSKGECDLGTNVRESASLLNIQGGNL